MSLHAKLIVTETLFQPFTFGGDDLDPVMLGEVLSMFIPLTEAEAEFPALSTQVADLLWPDPSADMIWGLTGPVPTPERESLQVNVAVTFALFQPFELGRGEAAPERTGMVSSILTVTEAEPVRPAWSVAVQVIVVPAVSDTSVVVPHPEDDDVMPDSESETVQLTVTVALFHPLELGLGVSVRLMTGGVVSTPN